MPADLMAGVLPGILNWQPEVVSLLLHRPPLPWIRFFSIATAQQLRPCLAWLVTWLKLLRLRLPLAYRRLLLSQG